MVKLNLFFDTFRDKTLDEKIGDFRIIRLKASVRFRTEKGFSQVFRAIIDTGAYVSVLPLTVWRSALHEKYSRHKMFGMSNKEQCSIDVSIGKVKCVIVDGDTNRTNEIKMTAFLALTDQVPLILGFKDLLENFKLVSDCKNNLAYLEVI
ncbi:hypothetical protein HY837_03885 [archaeon]|nr:hypothetical protein [archaeon]